MTTFSEIKKQNAADAQAITLAKAEAKAQAKRERLARLQELINQGEDEEDLEDRPIIEGGTELQQILNSTQVQLAKLVFKPSVLSGWKLLGGRHPLKIRQIWELTDAKTQCRNTIGNVSDTTECWICGLPARINSPECEHILPIAQAVLLLGLYSANSDMSIDDLKKEYAWAHKTCNQIKTDEVLIKEADDTPNKCEVSNEKIQQLLRNIFSNTRSYGKELKDELAKIHGKRGVAKFINQRLPAMITKLTPIVDTINSRFSSGGPGLTLLSSMIAAKTDVTDDLLSAVPSSQSSSSASATASANSQKSVESISDDVADILETFKKLDRVKPDEFSQPPPTDDDVSPPPAPAPVPVRTSPRKRGRTSGPIIGGTRRRTDRLFPKLHRKTRRRS